MSADELDDRSIAEHEAGHAVAGWLLGHRIVLVTMRGGPLDGPAVIDRFPPEPLDARRHPDAQWHHACDDAVIALAGPANAGHDLDDQVCAQDRWQAKTLVGSVTESEEEHDALLTALRLRAEAMVRHPQFAALADHLVDALLRDRELNYHDVRIELERATLRYIDQPHQENQHGTRSA